MVDVWRELQYNCGGNSIVRDSTLQFLRMEFEACRKKVINNIIRTKADRELLQSPFACFVTLLPLTDIGGQCRTFPQDLREGDVEIVHTVKSELLMHLSYSCFSLFPS